MAESPLTSSDVIIKQSEKAKFTATGDEDNIVVGAEAIGDDVYNVPVYPDIYAGKKATDVQDYAQDGSTGTGGGASTSTPSGSDSGSNTSGTSGTSSSGTSGS